MCKLLNQNILITGGASGIGKLMCEMALDRGIGKLVIFDIDKIKLAEVVNQFKKINQNVFGFVVDVSNTNQIIKTLQIVKKKIGSIDILINNAGIIIGKNFNEHSHKEIDFTLSINTNALMHIALELLPEMILRGSGHIVNIASAAGFVSNPKMSVYVASKFAVVGWSDSLRLEMERNKTGVHVSTVTPYYIDTGMFAGVKTLIPILKPEYAAKKIINGIEKNKIFIKMPFLIKLLPLFKGLLPLRVFDFVVGDLLRTYNTMNNFTGRNK